jgi:hypothetical protein
MLENPDLTSVFLIRMMFHATFLICFINLIVALMTVNVADVTSNMQAAWLVEISQLMIELELYWPRPYSYVRVLDNAATSSLPESLLAVDKTGKHSLNEGLNHKSKEYCMSRINVILYTASREAVVKSSWWTDYPKVDRKVVHDTIMGCSLFDLDYDFEEKHLLEQNWTNTRTRLIDLHNGPIQSLTTDNPPAILDETASNYPNILSTSNKVSRVKTPRPISCNSVNPIKRRLTANTRKGSIGSAQMHKSSAKSFIENPLATKNSQKSISDGLNRQSVVAVGIGSNLSAEKLNEYNILANVEHINRVEKLMRFEFQKNRELISKVEGMLQQQPNEKKFSVDSPPFEELNNIIEKLQIQVEKLQQQNRPYSLMDRIFGSAPNRTANRYSELAPSTRQNIKKTYPEN